MEDIIVIAALWLAIGVIADISAMMWLSHLDKKFWQNLAEDREWMSELPPHDIKHQIEETPWWAHAILIAVPFMALSVFSVQE